MEGAKISLLFLKSVHRLVVCLEALWQKTSIIIFCLTCFFLHRYLLEVRKLFDPVSLRPLSYSATTVAVYSFSGTKILFVISLWFIFSSYTILRPW